MGCVWLSLHERYTGHNKVSPSWLMSSSEWFHIFGTLKVLIALHYNCVGNRVYIHISHWAYRWSQYDAQTLRGSRDSVLPGAWMGMICYWRVLHGLWLDGILPLVTCPTWNSVWYLSRMQPKLPPEHQLLHDQWSFNHVWTCAIILHLHAYMTCVIIMYVYVQFPRFRIITIIIIARNYQLGLYIYQYEH